MTKHSRTINALLGLLIWGALFLCGSMPAHALPTGSITVQDDRVVSDSAATETKTAVKKKKSKKKDKTIPPLVINGLEIGQRMEVRSGSRAGIGTVDTVALDSLGRPIVDSLAKVKSDSLAIAKAKRDSTMAGVDTTSRQYRRSLREPFRVTQDTMKAGRMTTLSLIAPGFGQIYNRQYWKLPVIYAGIGGFLAGGFIYNSQYQGLKADYQRTIDLGLPSENQNAARAKMMQAGSSRTIFFALAGATYLYSIADATFNYRGNTDPIRKATTLAAIFPGMGFVYTKTYWRLPIYYGGFIALATVIDYNNRSYQRYKTAYDAMTDNNPATVDEFNGRYSPDLVARVRSAYRRDRDLAIIGMAAAYLLSVVDTYVIASLKNWDVSEDLAFRVEPTIIDTRFNPKGLSSAPSGYGLAMKLRF